ncbi:RNA 2',3'-cyclic phosphodiesterase [Sphingomonas sp. MMS24-J45]|uniref:RNA 2',3'-cyclic phosphodiesterase n=1 Tax=Sphingomonas sp. MMS24-J45 TaxID=3238806 RepID=UPI00384CC598
MPRLFVALRPPPEIRALLRALMAEVPGARWQSDAQLHLTLRYIGDVDASVADRIAAALAGIRAAPLALRFAGVGTFDRHGRVHTLWAGVAPQDAVAGLQESVDRALTDILPPPDQRPFVPHITLARRALGAGDAAAVTAWQQRHADLNTPQFIVSSLSLYNSVAGEVGSTYQELAAWRLQL